MLEYMLRTGEIAPGDMVAWRNYSTDTADRIGLCVALTHSSMLAYWSDGELVSYDAGLADIMLGTTICSLLQLPDRSSLPCLETPEGGIIHS